MQATCVRHVHFPADRLVSCPRVTLNSATLPCTLWFLHQGKATLLPSDRQIFPVGGPGPLHPQPRQIDYLANIGRLVRGQKPELVTEEDDDGRKSLNTEDTEDTESRVRHPL